MTPLFFLSPHYLICIFSAFIIELLIGNRKPSLNCVLHKEYQFLDSCFSEQSQENSPLSPLVSAIFCLANFFLVFFLINWLYASFPKWGMFAEILLLTLALDIGSIFDRNRRMEDLLKENKLGEARHLMGITEESRQKPENLFQAAFSKVSENTLGGIIGPLFFAFIGGLPTVYFYRTLAVLSTEKPDHLLGARLYRVLNLIPTLMAQFIIPIAGFAAGESFKEALIRLKQKRQSEGIFSDDIPGAACTGTLLLPDSISPEKIESETGEPSYVFPPKSEILGTPIKRLNRLTLEVAWVTICFFCIMTLL